MAMFYEDVSTFLPDALDEFGFSMDLEDMPATLGSSSVEVPLVMISIS